MIRELPYTLIGTLPDREVVRMLPQYKRTEHVKNFGNYDIWRGTWRNQITYAAYLGIELVSLIKAGVSWVHPNHRRQRLGTEVYATFAELEGFEVVKLDGQLAVIAKPALDIDTQNFTTAGVKLLYDVYKLLVERGVINNGETE